MHVNEHTVEIARTPDMLWPWLVQSTRLKQWVGGLLEFEPQDEGGPRVGARSRQVIELSGRRWELRSEITRFEPPRELAIRSEHGGFSFRQDYRLEPSDGRTRLQTRIETEYRKLFARLMGGVVTRQAQRKLEEDLARLKRLAEAE